MLWLFTQIWVWIVVALLLGVLAGWLFWARPLKQAADQQAPDQQDTAEEARADSSATN